MSIVADLLQLAEKIRDFLKARVATDQGAFESFVDPLYSDMETVVEGLLAMYEPAMRGVIAFRSTYMDLNSRRITELWEETYGGDARPTERERRRYDIAAREINHQVDAEEAAAAGQALQAILETFTEARKSTRRARIEVDAAAAAILDFYEDRNDRFANQMREFAAQIRRIVGRAHNDPLLPKQEPRLFGREDSPSQGVFDRLYAATKLWDEERALRYLTAPEASLPLSPESEEQLDGAVLAVDRTAKEMDHLVEVIETICNDVRWGWQRLAYSYAALRLLSRARVR